ncbi:MAG: glycosyltransferase, partial [Sphingobacteriales bacterium]
LLLTSTREGSPQIIKEAMACNLPIVSTDVGDIKDLLEGVRNCYVINSFDPKSFIGAIKSISELSHDKRSTNGRDKLISMELDSKSVARRIYDVYKELL